jgi:hypothetical protein
VRVECPYVGLVPFTEESARFFFGREADQAVLIANLFAARVTILYGASGVGKSSLLRAGVVKELNRRNAEARQTAGEPELRVVYFKEWQDRPLLRLEQRICLSAGRAEPSDESALADVLAQAADGFSGDVMVLLDQFEDYFKYPDVGPRAFDAELAAALQREDLPVSFVLSLRDDALSRLDRFQRLIPNLLANTLRVEALDAAQAADAIRRPLETYNRLAPAEQAHAGSFSIEDELVSAVLDQVRRGEVRIGDAGRGRARGAGGASVEAPYLQLVMMKVWASETASGSHVLRAATLKRLGGAQRIVQSHLDEVMRTLSWRQRRLGARLFEQLVTPGGNKIAHTASDLARFANAGDDEVERLLGTLSSSASRIVTPVAPAAGQGGASHFEIYHDALAPAVLDWRRRYRVRGRVREFAALAVVVAAVLGGWAFYQTRIAREAAEYAARAESARRDAFEAEKRARFAEDAARQEASKARKAEEELARTVQRHLQAEGRLAEAEGYRKKAEAAAAQRTNLEANIEQRTDELELAQYRIAQLQNLVTETQKQAAVHREDARQAKAALAPQPTPLRLLLQTVRVAQDGSDASTRWGFRVSAAGAAVMTVPGAAYSDQASAPIRIGQDATFDYQDGSSLDLEVVGTSAGKAVATGKQSVHLPRLADWPRPLGLKLPVYVEADPRQGAFVFEFTLQPGRAAAKKK